MKNFSDIQTLLDRYWEGETTLEEERILKDYFSTGPVDERLRAVAPLFQALRDEQSVQYTRMAQTAPLRPVQFSWQKMAAAAAVTLLLSAGAWWWAGTEKNTSEQYAGQSPVQQKRPDTTIQPRQIDSNEQHLAQNRASQPTQPQKKYKPKYKKNILSKPDPEAEMAMEEIKAALALVSSKIRKGKQEAAKGAVHLDNVDKIFKKKSEG